MKKIAVLFTALLLTVTAWAGHIAGGEIFYQYVGPGLAPGSSIYNITLRLFRECTPSGSAAQLPGSVIIGIFSNGSSPSLITSVTVSRTSFSTLDLSTVNPCINNAPEVCYQVATYTFTRELIDNADGYILSYQTCCRTNGLANIQPGGGPNGSSDGSTYTANIPGSLLLPTGKNSSAVFALKDTTLVCADLTFSFDFSATDPDGDSLAYSFCHAYNRGNATDASAIVPSTPPYNSLQYAFPYSGVSPLGAGVSIDPKTGIISGTAPSTGSFVVTVCVYEYRNGNFISIHRKDFTVKVSGCNLVAAQLSPDAFSCDSYTWYFSNESASGGGVASYFWDFGDGNTSTSPTPMHTYADTGIYKVKLKVTGTGGCIDSAEQRLHVFPTFNPGFTVVGSCFQTPFLFNDTSKATFGVVNKWRWDFGDNSTTADTSTLKSPNYLYPSPGNRNVRLIVATSKGCTDTVFQSVEVRDIPLLNLPFRDTLICSIDTLPLQAIGNGVFSWSPNLFISNTNIALPLVFPKDTTTYYVTLNENGCIKTDSIKVNVLDFITVDAGKDTAICLTDPLSLQPVSHALQYLWSPNIEINNTNVKNPVVTPSVKRTYYVTANLGKCQDADSITITPIPYPTAHAGNDTSICFGDFATLQGSLIGSSFNWLPNLFIQQANTLSPRVNPNSTRAYYLIVTDTLGCPKPVTDTVLVTVIPPIKANAGNDTSVVIGQPLQLQATGGTNYSWLPNTGLSNAAIANPVANYSGNFSAITYAVRVSIPEGCFAFDTVQVQIFYTGPEIFVPSAFTPNKDGRNDVLKPIVVGMQQFNYFRVYNRLGQLVYSTNALGQGWNGSINGKEQQSGTFVYTAEAIDYKGNKIFRKGTVVLIQ
jgi:gliding motility-associated-like protein